MEQASPGPEISIAKVQSRYLLDEGLWMFPVVIWAIVFCYVSGLRGFFALDQSIVFDGGWRVAQGQVPYRDFLIPFAPGVLWLQGAVFHLFGVNYRVYVMTAALLNGLAAGLAYGLVRKLVPERRWLAVISGLLTGAWLYAPMGTTYPEQTGFILVLVSVSTAVMGLLCPRRVSRWGWMFVAGTALSAAILCKTNAGIFGVPAVLSIVAWARRRPGWTVAGDSLAVIAGIGLVFAGFAGWLWGSSDPGMFKFAVITIPGDQGAKRLFGHGFPHFLAGLAAGKGNDIVRITDLFAVTVSVFALIAMSSGFRLKGDLEQRLRMLSVLVLALVGYEHLFSLSSSNNGVNEVPFIGVIVVLAAEILLAVAQYRESANEWPGIKPVWVPVLISIAAVLTAMFWRGNRSLDLVFGVLLGILVVWTGGWFDRPDTDRAGKFGRRRRWPVQITLTIMVLIFGLGAWISYSRNVQDIFSYKTRYVAREGIPPLAGLRWAEGIKAGEAQADWTDLAAVFQEVKDGPGRFFVMGDYTILYGLAHQHSVGPLLWFHKGLTYPKEYDVALDRKIADAVDQPDVTRIVLEHDTFMSTRILDDFPLLRESLRSHYYPAEERGIFQVYWRDKMKDGFSNVHQPATSPVIDPAK